MPPLNDPQMICEAAANLVFVNIKLTKNVPAFVNLPVEDQVNKKLTMILINFRFPLPEY